MTADKPSGAESRNAYGSILDEARSLVTGARQDLYGPPEQDYQAVAQIVSGMLRRDVTAAECAAVLLAVKLARIGHAMTAGLDETAAHDSLVDLAGYAHVLQRCLAAEETPHV